MANKNKIAKVLNLYADRPERRPVGAVMLARVPLFPPVHKVTKTMRAKKGWNKEYVYDPNVENLKTVIKVENPKALTFVHKKVFDSIILSALKIFENEGKTIVLVNPYKLKKLAGINPTTNNAYLLEIIRNLQDLRITIFYKTKEANIEERIIPISSVRFISVATKTTKRIINKKDNGELIRIKLTSEFVELINKSILYSLTPAVLQKLHKIKNPYLDYAIKFLVTQTKTEKFEFFTLLESVIFKEKLNYNTKKKVKKSVLEYIKKEKEQELLKQIGISIKEKDGKIYLSYTPKHAPAVTLFFPPRSKQRQSD